MSCLHSTRDFSIAKSNESQMFNFLDPKGGSCEFKIDVMRKKPKFQPEKLFAWTLVFMSFWMVRRQALWALKKTGLSEGGSPETLNFAIESDKLCTDPFGLWPSTLTKSLIGPRAAKQTEGHMSGRVPTSGGCLLNGYLKNFSLYFCSALCMLFLVVLRGAVVQSGGFFFSTNPQRRKLSVHAVFIHTQHLCSSGWLHVLLHKTCGVELPKWIPFYGIRWARSTAALVYSTAKMDPQFSKVLFSGIGAVTYSLSFTSWSFLSCWAAVLKSPFFHSGMKKNQTKCKWWQQDLSNGSQASIWPWSSGRGVLVCGVEGK